MKRVKILKRMRAILGKRYLSDNASALERTESRTEFEVGFNRLARA